jgi:hypothetical protein
MRCKAAVVSRYSTGKRSPFFFWRSYVSLKHSREPVVHSHMYIYFEKGTAAAVARSAVFRVFRMLCNLCERTPV